MENSYRDRDIKVHGASGFIQWKGTKVCADLYCECGYHGHIDDEFFYFYRCLKCKAVYGVGDTIKLIRLTPEETGDAVASGCVKESLPDLEELLNEREKTKTE